jgi:hypothetical protein
MRDDQRGAAELSPVRFDGLRPGDSGKAVAGRLMGVFPAWFVSWGPYSREFWAFPCFDVPPGTYLHARGANDLAGMMHRLQRSAWGER